MLLRLSRLSFWLAATVAAFALLAPGEHERLLAAIAAAVGLLALGLLRAALRIELPEPIDAATTGPARVLGEASLIGAAVQMVRGASAAGSRLTLSQIADVRQSEAEPAGRIQRRAAEPGRRAEDRHRGPVPATLAVAPRAPGSRGDVLLIEDSVVQPEIAARMLRRLGCRVSVASGIADGLNALRKTQFSLILVDTQMLGNHAAEGAKRLRATTNGACDSASVSDVPVIALSGTGLPGDGKRFRELGFDDHLSKPFRQSEMLAMLSKHLRSSAPAASKDTAVPVPVEVNQLHAAAEPVLDPAALARLGELDPKGANRLLERVLQAFQTSVARLRPQVDAARQSGDRAAIRLVAHTLKSSSASIGALRLSQLCGQIEHAIRLETADDLSGPLAALDVALDSALQAIDTLLKERV